MLYRGAYLSIYLANYQKLVKLLQFQIKNPLRDDEKGIWKCYIDDESINVDVDVSAIIEYKKYIKENTKLNEKLLIYCQVPYPSEYCFILSPNGTKYKPDKNYNPILGECAHSIDRVDQKDNGTWQCIFTRKPGEPMDIIKYDVIEKKKKINESIQIWI